MARLFPNTKEFTESAGALSLLKRRVDLSRPTLVLDVGCGTSPRTGGLIALCNLATTVHSMDPLLRDNWAACREVPNLYAHISTVEDWIGSHAAEIVASEQIAIVAVHSHAILDQYLPLLVNIYGRDKPLTVITIPCCDPQVLSPPNQELLNLHMVFRTIDWGVHSEKRALYVWDRAPALVADTLVSDTLVTDTLGADTPATDE
jgi:hypothetical protein